MTGDARVSAPPAPRGKHGSPRLKKTPSSKDINRFNLVEVEYIVEHILNTLLQVDAGAASKFNFSEIAMAFDPGVQLHAGPIPRRRAG